MSEFSLCSLWGKCVWSYEWAIIPHILYIAYLLLLLLWLILTRLCIAAMYMIGIYISLLSLLWTLPVSIHEIKIVYFLSRYRAKSTNTIDSRAYFLLGVPLCVCLGQLTLRQLMSYMYIYIYIWSTHSWCF